MTVPAWAWEREEARGLLQARDVPGLLRFAQRFGGASQTRLASATGISQGRISEILNGRKTVVAFEVYERVAEGIGMPDTARMLFGLAPKDVAAFTANRPPATQAEQAVPPQFAPLREEADEDVRRRDFVGLAGATLFQAATGPALSFDDIAAALTRYAGPPAAGPAARYDVAGLSKDVHRAKAGYQACHYTAVAKRLPQLLSRLDDAASALEGDERLRVHTLRAEAYHVAASVLLKTEERGLAWLAADRSMRAARDSENPTTAGASARVLTRALMRDRHYRAAADFASDAAQRVAEGTEEHTPDSLSVYGALLLSGSVAAAQREDRAQALILLEEAEDAGRRLGGDHNYQWTAFGPTNVLLHRVNAAVELGDAGSAIDYARRIDLDNIDVTERKAMLFVDASRAYSQWGKLDKAYQALATAERIAPEELATRPMVRGLLDDLRSRSTGHLHTSITELAERTATTR
ncbi:helix-turn-helix transcriptional regulator [Nocardiopsis sp. RSe5-2]|uniref:Helix-turn-helix transcriptional regulator n=1 Tax=Nocardiopsis endophytica TaxID=3018445 RepID=A0ABT4TWG6_9ACTN|nr:helix-turn-helix transcriptional regulator [Nocardiopsis endophytica]MDA2809048.1 helix-turn-helix transcriptional regulator [Nocardiopsis endophytica]